MDLRGKALPFPQHLRDTAFAKRSSDLNDRTGRDRDGCTCALRRGNDGLEDLEVHAHGVNEASRQPKCFPIAFTR